MTKREEQAIRKKRRELKRAEIEARKTERQERREKRELAKSYAQSFNDNGSKLPKAPFCEVCHDNLWCNHNFERRREGVFHELEPGASKDEPVINRKPGLWKPVDQLNLF